MTLAKRIEGTENVVAADLYPENMADSILEDLPDQSHYFHSRALRNTAELACNEKRSF